MFNDILYDVPGIVYLQVKKVRYNNDVEVFILKYWDQLYKLINLID